MYGSGSTRSNTATVLNGPLMPIPSTVTVSVLPSSDTRKVLFPRVLPSTSAPASIVWGSLFYWAVREKSVIKAVDIVSSETIRAGPEKVVLDVPVTAVEDNRAPYSVTRDPATVFTSASIWIR